jgi:hypothetical protein
MRADSRRMRSRLGLLAEHIAPATNDNVAMLVGAAGVGGSCVTLTQVEQYVRDGYVVVSGLLSPTVCSAAQESMWALMAGPPKPLREDKWAVPSRQRPRRNDPESCGTSWAGIVDGAVLDSFSAECMLAARVLSGAYERVGPWPMTQHPISRPTETLAINVFGNPDAEWTWPEPHTDSGATDDGALGWRTVPRPVRLQHISRPCPARGTSPSWTRPWESSRAPARSTARALCRWRCAAAAKPARRAHRRWPRA